MMPPCHKLTLMRIGVDAGGTFTDFVVLHDDGRLETFKLRSNPRAPAKVILAGLERAAANQNKVEVVHGSTVATNALLERKGARTAFVTTAGFEDLLEIGRQNRPELYNLMPAPRRPLVAARDVLRSAGACLSRWNRRSRARQRPSLKRLAARLKRAGVRSVAICFLHAYQNPANERAVARRPCANRRLSLRLPRNQPRISRVRARLHNSRERLRRPADGGYLAELERARRFRIAIMQSNGGFLSARDARRHAVRTVLSGPAGGVVGALETARPSGFRKMLGFDMGGTSTDVSLVDGVARETTEASVDGFPIRVPMLDIHTVGAGGGSIARVDAGGLLRVGPESAGADPGPACYGIGHRGHSHGCARGAGPHSNRCWAAKCRSMRIARGERSRSHCSASETRSAPLPRQASCASPTANMERAIRVVSVERGYDPREFALVAFGGCGGLHACEIAQRAGHTHRHRARNMRARYQRWGC